MLRAAREDVEEDEKEENSLPGKVIEDFKIKFQACGNFQRQLENHQSFPGCLFEQQQRAGQPRDDRALTKLLCHDARKPRVPQPCVPRALVLGTILTWIETYNIGCDKNCLMY